jgi:hypothetical protein
MRAGEAKKAVPIGAEQVAVMHDHFVDAHDRIEVAIGVRERGRPAGVITAAAR